MWMPGKVVVQHRVRAICLWLVLVVAIISYASWLIRSAVKSMSNPSTSFTFSDDAYKYPDVMVCLYEGYGCDTRDQEGNCIWSIDSTHAGPTSATFNPGADTEQDIEVVGDITQEKGYCATFYTSALEVAEGSKNPEDYILFNMYWYPGGKHNTSTTCIEEEGAWQSHSERVYIFLKDADTGELSAGIQAAYSCMTSQSSSHIFNYMGIGLTKEVKLKTSESSATYKVFHQAISFDKDQMDESITGIVYPYAYLTMEVAQEVDSLEIITEVDPLEYAEIFGEVGGAWDLLLLLWPICFVAVTQEAPSLKARNFRKSVRRGHGLVRSMSSVSFSQRTVRGLSDPRRSIPTTPLDVSDSRRSKSGTRSNGSDPRLARGTSARDTGVSARSSQSVRFRSPRSPSPPISPSSPPISGQASGERQASPVMVV